MKAMIRSVLVVLVGLGAVTSVQAQRVALVENTEAGEALRIEIDSLQAWLGEMSLEVVRFEADQLRRDALLDFDLTIWNDLGFSLFGLTDSSVAAFEQLINQGQPIYFIGDDLAYARFVLSDTSAAAWVNLIHLDGSDNDSDGAQVAMVDPTHPVLDGPYGVVSDFAYPLDMDQATATNTGERVLAQTDQGDAVIVAFGEEGGGVRTLTQNVLAVHGGDAASQAMRKRLFKNGVTWLLGPTTPTSTEADVLVPGAYALSALYPNPFTQQTRFALTVVHGQPVRIAAYNVLGRRVAVLHEGRLGPQEHHFTFEGQGLPGGLYLIRVVGERFTATRRVVLTR